MNPDYITTVARHVGEIWTSLCISCTTKVLTGGIVASLLYLVGANNIAILQALLVLIAIDFVTAIGGAYTQGVPIESRRALKGATKVIVYATFVSAGHLTSLILLNTIWIEVAVMSFLALTELVSIMENIGKMGYTVPQTLLNRIKELRDNK